jgi:exosortase H (IPTLxxWG-CTERM-specific)
MPSSKKQALSPRSRHRLSSVARQKPWIFIALFTAFFMAGFALLLSPLASPAVLKFSRSLVGFSGILIGMCGGHVRVEGAVLRDPFTGFAIEMKDGCNAANVTILLWSAMLAFPAPWRMKAVGLLAGSLVIQAVNIVRFISLFYLGLYSATLFDFAHSYLWECMLVLDTMVVFWLWVNRLSRSSAASNAV